MISRKIDPSAELDGECLVIGCLSPWSREITLQFDDDKEEYILRLCDDCAKYLEDKINEGEPN